MKGAEGPGRGGPRGCGGRELAPDRRSPGGNRAAPGGSCAPQDPGSAVAFRLLGAHLGTPTSCALPRDSDTSELGFLQSSFEAARLARGLRACTWARARVARGGVAFGSLASTEAAGWTTVRVPQPGKALHAPPLPSGGALGQGTHKALLWLGDGGHRVAFVPPLTQRQARLIAGPGQGAG